jgi:Fe-S cluster assembly protein SufD
MSFVNHYVTEYQRVEKQLTANDLPWLQTLRKKALDFFEMSGFPDTRLEPWKYTNTAPIAQGKFTLLSSPVNPSEKFFLPEYKLGIDCYQFVFVDGRFSESLSDIKDFPIDARIDSIANVLKNSPALLEPYLTCQISLSIFTKLNLAFLHDGYYLHVPENVKLTKPVYILFIASGENESLKIPLRNIMVADKNSEAFIIENYVSYQNNSHFTNTFTEIYLADNAKVEHMKHLQESQKAFHIGTLQVRQAKDSHFISHSIARGGKLTRSDIEIIQAGENAISTLNGLYLAKQQQHIDHHTTIHHIRPHGKSQQNYKGIITDKARAVFNGQVLVHKNAQKTSAQQSNKNLLLSLDAEIDTKPQLEIFADDVQCTHGATVGQLDDEALFYLRSRGISEAAARTMLINSFVQDVIDKISIKSLREKFENIEL